MMAGDRPEFLDTREPLEILFFEVSRREPIVIAVPACCVVEHLDPIVDVPT